MEKSDDTNKNDTEETGEIKTKNESEKIDGSSGCLFEAVCSGYNVRATLSLTFSFDSIDAIPRSENILVGKHLNWYLYANKKTFNGEEYLTLFANTLDRNKYPMKYNVVYTLEAKEPRDRIVHDLSRLKYDEADDYLCFGSRMITCNRFLNERDKFEIDGKITGIAKIKVRMPMCYNFVGTKSLSDVMININSELFPFSKMCLAFHSQFFHAMFFGQFAEAKQDEVTIADVDTSTFVKLINVLFVRSFELQLNSVPSVLELADRFGMLSVVNHCEKLLVSCGLDSEPSLAERLALATKHSLNGLQERCLKLCTSAKIVNDVMESPFYEELADRGRALLLDRVMKVLPAHVLR